MLQEVASCSLPSFFAGSKTQRTVLNSMIGPMVKYFRQRNNISQGTAPFQSPELDKLLPGLSEKQNMPTLSTSDTLP